MWDVSRQPGPLPFEQEAARALAAWRAGQFELPDYYLALAAGDVRQRPGRRGHQGRTSTSARCARPGRTGWRWSPRPSPPSRPRVS